MAHSHPPQLAGLLSAAREALDDDNPRLVLADWLEEHGQPQRAEFVRVQVALERANKEHRPTLALARRAEVLLAARWSEWLGPLAACDAEIRNLEGWPRTAFSRGLVRLAVRADDFLERNKEWTSCPEWQWVEGLHFDCLHAEAIRRLATLPGLVLPPWLEDGLDYDDVGEGEMGRETEGPRLLGGWPGLAGIQALHLGGSRFEPGSLAALFHSPHAAGLRDLFILKYLGPGDDLASHLARASHVARLRSLSLGTGLRKDGVKALAGAAHLAGLASLTISLNDSLDGCLPILARGPFAKLERLNVVGQGLGRKGGSALAAFPALAYLNIATTMLSAAGLEQLLGSSLAGRLVSLDLPESVPASTVTKAVAGAAALAGLRSLAWNGFEYMNQLGDDGARALADAASLSGLARLVLYSQSVGKEAWRLFASPPWAGLHSLGLACNPIDDEAALAIATSANLSQLESLSLTQCEVGDAGAWAIATAAGLPGLCSLNLAGCAVSNEMRGTIRAWLSGRKEGMKWDATDSPLSDAQKALVREAAR
jgi:uncharacterized protein (TIGR02996 family)